MKDQTLAARLERRIYHDNRGNAYMRQHGTFYRRGVKLNKKQRAAAKRKATA